MQNEAPLESEDKQLAQIRPFLGRAKDLDPRTLEVVLATFRRAKVVEGAEDGRPKPVKCPVCDVTVDGRLVAVEVRGRKSEMLPGQVVHLVLAHEWWHPTMDVLVGRPEGKASRPLPSTASTARPSPSPASLDREVRLERAAGQYGRKTETEVFPFSEFADPASVAEVQIDVSSLLAFDRSADGPASTDTRPIRASSPGRVDRRPAPSSDRRPAPGRRPGRTPPDRPEEGRRPVRTGRPADRPVRETFQDLQRDDRPAGRQLQPTGRQLPVPAGAAPRPDDRQGPDPGRPEPGILEQISDWFRDLFSAGSPPSPGGQDGKGRWDLPDDVDGYLLDPSGRQWGPGYVPAGEYELHVQGRPPLRTQISANRSYRATGLGRMFDVVDPS